MYLKVNRSIDTGLDLVNADSISSSSTLNNSSGSNSSRLVANTPSIQITTMETGMEMEMLAIRMEITTAQRVFTAA